MPSTAVLSAMLLLVPPDVALGIAIFGMMLFYLGEGINRPILLGFGGVLMFAGALSWGFRQ